MINAKELLPLLESFLKQDSFFKTFVKETYKPDTYKYISGNPSYRVVIPYGMPVDTKDMVLIDEEESFNITLADFKEKLTTNDITVDFKHSITIIDETRVSMMLLHTSDSILISNLMSFKNKTNETNCFVTIHRTWEDREARIGSFLKVEKSRFGSYRPVSDYLGSTAEEIDESLKKLALNNFITRDEMIFKVVAESMQGSSYLRKINKELNGQTLWSKVKKLFT